MRFLFKSPRVDFDIGVRPSNSLFAIFKYDGNVNMLGRRKKNFALLKRAKSVSMYLYETPGDFELFSFLFFSEEFYELIKLYK